MKADKTNYNALVFFGKCASELGQLDQAHAAYRKAIESDDTQPLAWQVEYFFLSFLKESFPCRKILVYVDQVRFTLLGLLVFLKETSTAICTKTETQRFFLVMHCCKLSFDMKFAVILLGAVCREIMSATICRSLTLLT